jgi:hypothetical protein
MAEPISILHSILATNFPGPLCSSTPTKTRARSSVRFVEACGVTAGARRQRAAASRKNSARDYYLRAMPRKPVLAISVSHPLMIWSARFQRAALASCRTLASPMFALHPDSTLPASSPAAIADPIWFAHSGQTFSRSLFPGHCPGLRCDLRFQREPSCRGAPARSIR